MAFNGKTKKGYDLIVIGAGSGGLSVGLSMHKLGFKVLLIDKADHEIGGDCLNYGCIPSKALIHVSKIIHHARQAGQFGISSINKPDIHKIKKYIVDAQSIIREHENQNHFTGLGLDVALGTAKFVSEDKVEVNGKIYNGKKIIIATGSRPKILNIPGIEAVKKIYTNKTIFDIDFLPENLLIIGAGPIGLELGQAFHRFGSRVSIVDIKERILDKEDDSISQIAYERLTAEGIFFYLNSTIIRFISPESLLIQNKHQTNIELNFDAVLMAAGRDLNIEELDLDKAGIKTDRNRIVADGYLRTSNKKVYVTGDAAGSLQFSHGAELHAMILLNNFFSPLKKKLSYDNFSWVTFTDPEIATFGLNEATLRDRGISYEKLEYDFSEDDRAIVSDYRFGKLILFVKKGWFPGANQKILGGTMIAPEAGEMIQEFILAQMKGLGIKDIFNKIYPYPTASRVNKNLVVQKYSDQLNSFIKIILKILY